MKNTLIKKKYVSLLVTGMIAMLIEYLVLLSDNIIVGQLIGEDGLAATTLVMPFLCWWCFSICCLSPAPLWGCPLKSVK